MFQRCISIPKNHSFFLFGPRGVGKSTLLRRMLSSDRTYYFDLLDYDLESRLIQRPREFSQILEALPSGIQWVVLDEVQKVPFLLDEVHRYIELKPQLHFALTGSSARKLKRGQANLLAGRAFTYSLYPLCSTELGRHFDLDEALQFGTLPKIYSLKSPVEKKQFLRSYAQTYLKEEIQMEGLSRNLPAFQRLLPIAASENGQILSWSNFSQDTGIDAKTVRSYYGIMEDTLIGFFLPAYARSLRKRQKKHPKFYLFDTGVKRALANELNLPLVPGTAEYGRAFEHFWILEIVRHNSYRQTDFSLSYFATHDVEIDLVIERPGRPILLVEIKSAERVKDAWLRPLHALAGELKNCEALCICREPRKRKVGKVLICPWQDALTEIGLAEPPSEPE